MAGSGKAYNTEDVYDFDKNKAKYLIEAGTAKEATKAEVLIFEEKLEKEEAAKNHNKASNSEVNAAGASQGQSREDQLSAMELPALLEMATAIAEANDELKSPKKNTGVKKLVAFILKNEVKEEEIIEEEEEEIVEEEEEEIVEEEEEEEEIVEEKPKKPVAKKKKKAPAKKKKSAKK